MSQPSQDAADPPGPLPPPPLQATRERWWLLLTVMLGTVASIMSSTIVNVAVPELSATFDLGQGRAQWLSTGFMAATTVSMLATPWLLARLGYRRTYTAATLMLLAGGIGGGLAFDYGFVVAMRVVEGLAAGIMQPIPAIIILRAFSVQEQGKAMGIFGMGVVLAPALGPSIGGLLVEHLGWRSIFFVVVPFCIAALAMARRYLPTFAPGGVPPRHDTSRFDFVGFGLVVVALLALLNGLVALEDAGPGRSPLLAAGLLALAAVATVGFVAHLHRMPRPLLNPALFRQRAFAMGSLVAFIYGMALFGSTYLVPVFMQMALALPPSQAGAVLFPAGIALGLTIPLAGRLADRVPIHRLVVAGLLLLTLSFALMLVVGPGTSLLALMAWTAIGRIGLGFVLPSLNLSALRSLDPVQLAQGASAINFVRQLGGAIGVNLIGIFLGWRLHAHGAAADSPALAQLPAFHEAFAVVAIVTALAVLAAFGMKAPAAGAARAGAGDGPAADPGRRT